MACKTPNVLITNNEKSRVFTHRIRHVAPSIGRHLSCQPPRNGQSARENHILPVQVAFGIPVHGHA